MQYKDIHVNAMSDAAMNKIMCVQGDTARALRIYTDIDLSVVTSAQLYLKKPDNTEVYLNCTVGTDYITVNLTSNSLAAIGHVVCQLSCVDTSLSITTYKFIIEVLKSYISDSAIESSNEYNALVSILETANSAIADSAAEMTDHTKTYYLTVDSGTYIGGYVYRWDSTTSQWVAISGGLTSTQVQITEVN